MHRSLWRFFCSINLSIWLLFAISFTLLIGSFYAKQLPVVFSELNVMRFQEWLPTHGLASSWWLWLLFLLLSLFVANTAACTFERFMELLKKRREFPFRTFALLISPSIMHLCFLTVIGGHAISQFCAETTQLPVRSGITLQLSSGSMTVVDNQCEFRSESELTGILRACTTRLTFASAQGTESGSVGLMEPITLGGYRIHLILAGKAKPGKIPETKLVIKKDPGLTVILMGNLLLCLLMLWYFPVIIRKRKGAKSEDLTGNFKT